MTSSEWIAMLVQLVTVTAPIIGGFTVSVRQLKRSVKKLHDADRRHDLALASLGRKLERVCVEMGVEEITGRHSVPPEVVR